MVPPFLPDYVGVVLFTNCCGGRKFLSGEGGRFGGGKKPQTKTQEVKNDGGEEAEGCKAARSRRSRPAEQTPVHLIP